MDFKRIEEKYSTLSEAKAQLYGSIKRNESGKMIGYIVKESEVYVIYYNRIISEPFIDDIIDYVQNHCKDYIECIMLPFYDNTVITIEIAY